MTTIISPDGLAEIKRLHAGGLPRAQIAKVFGVTLAAVKEAVRNRNRTCPALLSDGSVCAKPMSRVAKSCARCARRHYWARFRSQNATSKAGPCVGGAHHRILDERNMGVCIHCGDQRQYPSGDEWDWNEHGLDLRMDSEPE